MGEGGGGYLWGRGWGIYGGRERVGIYGGGVGASMSVSMGGRGGGFEYLFNYCHLMIAFFPLPRVSRRRLCLTLCYLPAYHH